MINRENREVICKVTSEVLNSEVHEEWKRSISCSSVKDALEVIKKCSQNEDFPILSMVKSRGQKYIIVDKEHGDIMVVNMSGCLKTFKSNELKLQRRGMYPPILTGILRQSFKKTIESHERPRKPLCCYDLWE